MNSSILAEVIIKFGSVANPPIPRLFWVVAVPCVCFVLFLYVDACVMKIKKRRQHKLEAITNEISKDGRSQPGVAKPMTQAVEQRRC